MRDIYYIPIKITSKLGMNKIYQGCHWVIRKKDKDMIFQLVKHSIKAKKNYIKPVKLEMYFNSKLDVSNHAYLFKMIEDSLVGLGMIQDDTDKYVKEITLGKQKEKEGIIVAIEEIEDD